MKNKIHAVMWYFGFTKKAAREYIRNANAEAVRLLLEAWQGQAKKAFYCD